MIALVIVLLAVLVIAEPSQSNTAIPTQAVPIMEADEGDIGQIFGISKPIPASVIVIIEEPAPQVKVDCYQTKELVRDLTVPYGQRTYIQPDGSHCTPVE